MAQGGFIGSGAKVGYATGSPHTWKKLEQLMDVAPPTAAADKVDTTVHGTVRYKQNISGLQDLSPMNLKMLRDADSTTSPNQNALKGLLDNQTLVWWRVELPADGSLTLFEAYEFQGRVSSFKPTAPIAGAQMLESDVIFGGSSWVRYEPMASLLG